MALDSNWSKEEIEAAVAAYFELFDADNRGERFSPTAVHRRLANNELVGRSEGSVARRMSNISSVLRNNGRAWISRYKPSLDHVGTRVEAMILEAAARGESGMTFPDYQSNDLLTRATNMIRRGKVEKPVGNPQPVTRSQTVTVFARDPRVVAWVLQEAEGKCEACQMSAPFSLSSGIPYLEVHHVLRLVDGGPDVVENAVALCPNCHRRLHHSADADDYRSAIIVSVGRLSDFRK